MVNNSDTYSPFVFDYLRVSYATKIFIITIITYTTVLEIS